MNIVKNAFGAFGVESQLIFLRYFIYSSLTILALIFIVRFTISLIKRIHSTKIARQTIITGKFTFKELKEVLGSLKNDQEVLECLEKKTLEFRH